MLLFHDESTYHSNEDQGWMWAEKGNQPIRPKGLDRGIMVSDFVDEFNGLLSLTPDEFVRGRVEYPDLKLFYLSMEPMGRDIRTAISSYHK